MQSEQPQAYPQAKALRESCCRWLPGFTLARDTGLDRSQVLGRQGKKQLVHNLGRALLLLLL